MNVVSSQMSKKSVLKKTTDQNDELKSTKITKSTKTTKAIKTTKATKTPVKEKPVKKVKEKSVKVEIDSDSVSISEPIFEIKNSESKSNMFNMEEIEVKKPKKRGRKPKETNLVSNSNKLKITNLHMENEDVIVKLKIRPEVLSKIPGSSTQLRYNPNILNQNPEPSQESSKSEFAQFKYEPQNQSIIENPGSQLPKKYHVRDESGHIDLKQAISERNREARSWFGTRQKEQVTYDIPMPDPGQYIFDSSSTDPNAPLEPITTQEITTRRLDLESMPDPSLVFKNKANTRNVSHDNSHGQCHDPNQFFGNVLPTESKNLLKKVHNIHCEFTEAGKRKNWPDRTSTACYWDSHQFDTMPVIIPTKYFCKTFYFDISKGCFCSFNCAMAYLIEHSMTEQISLLLYFYNCIFDTFVEQIKPALPRQFLKLFGGTMDINLFRKNSIDLRREYNLIIPPTFVFNVPKLEETVSTRVDPRTYTIPSSTVKTTKSKTRQTQSIKNLDETDGDGDSGSGGFSSESEHTEDLPKIKTKFSTKVKKGAKQNTTTSNQSIAQFMSYFN